MIQKDMRCCTKYYKKEVKHIGAVPTRCERFISKLIWFHNVVKWEKTSPIHIMSR